MDPSNFEDATRHSRFIADISDDVNRSDDLFIAHHKKDLNNVFPLWVVIDVASFGVLSKFFKNMKVEDRNNISKTYIGFGRKYVENWLQSCSYCRNVAAHGGRFYNRELKACPVRLNHKRYPGISNTSAFAFVIAITNLLPSEDLRNSFVSSIEKCFIKHPFALKKYVGFPEDWITVLTK